MLAYSAAMAGPLPLPFRLLVPLIRCLPIARYRAAFELGRLLPPRFVTKLPRKFGGLSFVCEREDVIARMAFAGCWEPTQTLLVTRLLQPGMTFVDLGAQWGYFTLVGAARVGAYGSVVSLEPHARLFSWLRDNVDRNHLRQVTPLPVAAGATTSYQELVPYDEGTGNFGSSWLRPGPISPTALHAAAGDRIVEVRTLDDLAREHELETIDLVKMDVEGAEGAAVRGMRDLLSQARVRRLLIEVHVDLLGRGGSSLAALYDDLWAAGYRGLSVREDVPTVRAIAYGRRRHTRGLLSPLDPRARISGIVHQLWLAPGASALTPGG
jgi:FkbM family methyltransferase